MELFLLQMAVFLRPIGSIEYLAAIFEVIGLVTFLLVVGSFLVNGSIRRSIVLTPTDLLMFAFIIWCISLYVIYPETPRLRAASDIAKASIPLVTYTVVHNVIRDREDFRRLLFWMVIGFIIPTLLSAILIVIGEGVYWVSYWTGIPRWRGAYFGPHAMGHSMALLLIVLIVYGYFLRDKGWRKPQLAGLVGLGMVAVVCLALSQVRSAMLGLICFVTVMVALTSRKLLIAGSIVFVVGATISMPYWLPWVAPEVVTLEQGRSEVMDLGSSRPKYWTHNLSIYANLPIDQKIAGTGLASRAVTMDVADDEVLDSHNDWLDLLMQTGLVGLVLYLLIQFSIFRKARRLEPPDRNVFVALVIAVNVIMFVSNSLVWRIQVGQLYFALLAYVEFAYARAATAAMSTSAHFVAPVLPKPTLASRGVSRRGAGQGY